MTPSERFEFEELILDVSRQEALKTLRIIRKKIKLETTKLLCFDPMNASGDARKKWEEVCGRLLGLKLLYEDPILLALINSWQDLSGEEIHAKLKHIFFPMFGSEDALDALRIIRYSSEKKGKS